MCHKSFAVKVLLVTLLLFSLWPDTVIAEKKIGHILIIANSADEPYRQAIAGFKDELVKHQPAKFTDLYLHQLDNNSALIENIIRENSPDIIYSLGEQAAKQAMKYTKIIPIVTTLVFKSDLFQQAKNITGVSLGYPLKTRIEWLQKIFPGKVNVAVLFNSERNTATIRDFGVIARRVGITLTAIPVETQKQLPYALEQLGKNVDVLLAIPDDITMTPHTAEEVLLASFRNKVPLIGLSDNWVKSGALYALTWDYNDLGKQCAIQAIKLLKGTLVEQVYPEFPRKITYSINARIAGHMNVEISEYLLKNAQIIFN